MVLYTRNTKLDETMPQTVPSAGFTPPCDYSNFAENFDLSLLPGGDQPLSPSTPLYIQSPPPPKIFTTFYPNSPEQQTCCDNDIKFTSPDFQTLLVPDDDKYNQHSPSSSPINRISNNNICLEVQPSFGVSSPASSPTNNLLSPNSNQNDQFGLYRQQIDFYPSSPELSLYTSSPGSVYSRSPCDDYLQNHFNIKKENQYLTNNNNYSTYRVKEENYLSPCSFSSSPTSPSNSNYSNLSSPEQFHLQQTDNTDVLDLLENTVLDKQIKQESTVDFTSILQSFHDTSTTVTTTTQQQIINNCESEKPKDHQLLREVLKDTSFQKKYNIKPFDFDFIAGDLIKMEEPDDNSTAAAQSELMRENIEPVLNLAIEQMRKDVDNTCAALGISPDPTQWSPANVLSWLQWTSRQFSLSEPVPEQWDMSGANLARLTEEDFTRRSPQGGMILHAQLEIWKAAYSDDDLSMQWLPETTSSNASSGDISDDDDEEASTSHADPVKPTTSSTVPTTSTRTGGSHIHLWQFLKELLASPQTHGSCIRWLDRSKGIFKIEDSVKVARLWGKRKNRPAMNYDKLSRSIRQYYKKGIMKKTERSQRLVYQFCHPYNL